MLDILTVSKFIDQGIEKTGKSEDQLAKDEPRKITPKRVEHNNITSAKMAMDLCTSLSLVLFVWSTGIVMVFHQHPHMHRDPLVEFKNNISVIFVESWLPSPM